jgi:hypothetical protein
VSTSQALDHRNWEKTADNIQHAVAFDNSAFTISMAGGLVTSLLKMVLFFSILFLLIIKYAKISCQFWDVYLHTHMRE